jgi:hypothetical protein
LWEVARACYSVKAFEVKRRAQGLDIYSDETAHNVTFCQCSNTREKAEASGRNVVKTDAKTKKVLPGSCWSLDAEKIKKYFCTGRSFQPAYSSSSRH